MRSRRHGTRGAPSPLKEEDEGLYVVDERGCVTFVNARGAALLGYGSPAELVGMPVLETLDGVPRDARNVGAAPYPYPDLALLETCQSIRGQGWFVRKDGSGLAVAHRSLRIPLAEGSGAITAFGAIVAFRDISPP